MSEKPFRPLLAATIDDPAQLADLQYPLMTSPKIDGVRCTIHLEGPCSRSMKLIPNRFVQDTLGTETRFLGFDGELCVGPPNASNVFAKTVSAVMSEGGEPDFAYWCFDDYIQKGPFAERFRELMKDINGFDFPHRLQLVPHTVALNVEEVLKYEKEAVEQGYEGLMLRRMDGRYKQGRSTLKEQILLKLKRFEDAEAVIIGFEELERNQNEAVKDNLGHTRRSSHQAGKVLGGMLGNLRVRHETMGDFNIGSGFDVALRQEIWDNQSNYLGKLLTFKFQRVGIVDKPRFPIFKAFRPKE